MKLLFLAERPLENRRDGGSIRRNGFLKALTARDVHVETQWLSAPRPGANFLRRFSGLDVGGLVSVAHACDVVHVEGVPLWPVVRAMSAMGVPIAWDLCDSWALKYVSELLYSRRASALPRAAASAYALNAASSGVERIYISVRDGRTDDRLLVRRGRWHVVGNGIDVPAASEHRGQRSVMLGDWTYPPNRRSFDWLDRAVREHGATSPGQVDIYGVAAESLPSVPWGRIRGYARSVTEVFAAARIVLAPVVDGAGVKNKVLEAAAAGVPVVTTKEGARGVPECAWVAVARSRGDFVTIAREWTLSPPPVPPKAVAHFRENLNWSNSAAALERVYAVAIQERVS